MLNGFFQKNRHRHLKLLFSHFSFPLSKCRNRNVSTLRTTYSFVKLSLNRNTARQAAVFPFSVGVGSTPKLYLCTSGEEEEEGGSLVDLSETK